MANKTQTGSGMIPGEMKVGSGHITLNPDMPTISVSVSNVGDRPIQIGSHYHFYEANDALIFERELTLGFRLNIAAGTAIRFEPGQSRTVELVAFGGNRMIYGFQGKIMGSIDEQQRKDGSTSKDEDK
ncbi:urease subunit beta [Moritella viscosa]|uniref:Urease subunit beta n=2 Tax=Moritella viscosa TaxID=80854 RepID=A0A090IFM7_9GAMM|nr:urease beta subunit [Moritella viscosa]SGY82612.1 Urease subunit beta-Urea amidohydrolase subunit beta [Moritella viscosa]SGY83271.1 Urease subunit beta-Urea amidohydrolase subunit beta [Moritella viscosa]SGY83421.1 Urease subunit beta-Urea amidohydrolase subunit beta [Moritella viscosa]SHN96919.1 Urease subunit beta-Urea amidohydrolase subunit beta [Moritella viscosa]